MLGGDLMARDRLLTAAAAAGAEVVTSPFGHLVDSLTDTPVDTLVVDLDEGREGALEEVETARDSDLLPPTVIGYFSHVDDALRRAAVEAGCTPIPRGKFWQEIATLLR